jgi:LPS-assembly lipoprotein
MSWSRRWVLAAAAVGVAACGFTPALAPSGPAAELRGDIEVAAPNTRAGFILARQVEDRLGLPAAPAYRLRLEITEGAEVTGIPANRVTARANLLGRVDYSVVHIPSAQVVRQGSVQSFTGFSATSTTAATRAAAEDAQRRLMVLLADRLVAELLATSEEWRG